ncbi:MAG: carboxypeptidase regulatory-like domain-containing protein, partial [Actinobacteria bacterium]|nr:carboxypeptidase regulatory-like domain-containing protein [Actinomycetota bacterium]
MRGRWTRGWGLGMLAAALALGVAAGSAAKGGATDLGDPPKQCDTSTYEWLKSHTCLVQSRALVFSIEPKTVKVGEVVTATARVIFPSPPNNPSAPGVGWQWSSLEGWLGTRLDGCGPEKGSSGLVSRCRYRTTRATNAWVTVELGHGTFQGGAISRDYFAVVEGGKEEGAIEGKVVLAPELRGIPRVPLRAIGTSGRAKGRTFGASTTATGSYRMGEVPTGSYTVSVSLPEEYELDQRSRPVSVASGGIARADFVARKPAPRELEISLDAAPKPAVFPLTVTDKGDVQPRTIRVEVRVKNTSKKTLRRIRLVGLFPQPVDPTTKPDQLAFAKGVLPVEVGTLAPGAMFARAGTDALPLEVGTLAPGAMFARAGTDALPLEVTGDGEYRIRALVTYAESSLGRTLSAAAIGGRFEVTVPPLWFDARLEQTGYAPAGAGGSAAGTWVKAGQAARITGRVKNLSSVRTLCLEPVVNRARLPGNSSGWPIDITRFKVGEDAPPLGGVLKPKESLPFTHLVRTVVDGAPRGTVEYAPRAGVLEEGSECVMTERAPSPLGEKEIVATDGSTSHRLSVDVRDPRYTPTVGSVLAEWYGGFMYGAAKGSADFFSAGLASARESLSPESLLANAANAADPLGAYRGFARTIKAAELLGRYWETAPEEEKKKIHTHVWSVLSRATGDGWAPIRSQIDSIVDPFMQRVAVSAATGNYDDVANALGSVHGYVGQQVTLSIALAGIGDQLVAQLPALATRFKAAAQVVTYRSLKGIPPGKIYNATEKANLLGISAKQSAEVRAVAVTHRVRIGAKGRSPASIKRLELGDAWKPEPIKPKNTDMIDREWLNFKSPIGTVAAKRFSPKERAGILKRIADSNLTNEQKQVIIDRLALRLM